MGCDHFVFGVLCSVADFNPRTHMGCDLPRATPRRAIALFQSTHPHGVRHVILSGMDRDVAISIHAPTWGATATALLKSVLAQNFNPRTHMGCDVNGDRRAVEIAHFNPRTHMGCDRRSPRRYARAGAFQSTHPHGVRPRSRQGYQRG